MNLFKPKGMGPVLNTGFCSHKPKGLIPLRPDTIPLQASSSAMLVPFEAKSTEKDANKCPSQRHNTLTRIRIELGTLSTKF